MRTPLVVSYGINSTAGIGVGPAWDALVDESVLFSKQNFFESPKYVGRVFGVARGGEGKDDRLPNCERLLLPAVDEAAAGADLSGIDPKRVGVFVGTSIGNVLESENALEQFMRFGGELKLSAFDKYECSSLAAAAARRIGARGINFAVSTACSSSGVALSTACSAIAEGVLDAALVCGVDALSRITVNGFGSLQLLSKGACKPFDRNRDGITLGEAACALLLVCGKVAEKLGLKPLARISGWSCTADAYHPTAPHPEAEGVFRAVENTLKMAGRRADDAGCWCAHGTATRANDSAECAAMKRIFAAAKVPPFFSVKGKFGHTLGASGALNVAVCAEAMRRGVIPKSFGYGELDGEIGIAPNVENKACKIESAISVSAGFGGNNACALLEADCEPRAEACARERGARGRAYLSGAGAVFRGKEGWGGILEKALPEDGASGKILMDIPPLKKRRWAKLQQMALSAARQACAEARGFGGGANVGVCFGTGLGMAEQTAKFLENVIGKAGEEPLPTSFTNSVHNAVTSAIASYMGFKGFNSAVSAKEASFECALWQGLRELNCGACEAIVAGACDEYSPYAAQYMSKRARFSKLKGDIADLAAAYLVTPGLIGSSFGRIDFLDISAAERRPADEVARIKKLARECGAQMGGLKAGLSAFSYNSWQKGYIEKVFLGLGCEKISFLEDSCAPNYSLSSFYPIYARLCGKGKYLCYTKTSLSQAAVLLVEIF